MECWDNCWDNSFKFNRFHNSRKLGQAAFMLLISNNHLLAVSPEKNSRLVGLFLRFFQANYPQILHRKIAFPWVDWVVWGYTVPLYKMFNIPNYLNTKLGGGFKYVLFSSRKLGKIPILTHIFQLGWFNHQLEKTTLSEILTFRHLKPWMVGRFDPPFLSVCVIRCHEKGPPENFTKPGT